MDGLLFIKIIVSILSVLGLSLLTERVSPRLAGLLSGYPIGTAIALFFIGLEQGADFAAQGAVFTLAGLAATLTFAAGYYYGSLIAAGRILSTALAAIVALSAFFLACLGLRFLPLSPATATLPPLAAILFYGWLFHHLPEIKVTAPVRLGKRVLFVRASLSAAVVIAITGSAACVGPEWAGLFSAFPSTVFPLLLIIHLHYGTGPIHSLIRNYPRGMGALVIYVILVHVSYPAVGIGIGTALSFAAATLYLLAYGGARHYLARRRSGSPSG